VIFLEPRFEKEYDALDRRVIGIVAVIEALCRSLYYAETTVTSVWRNDKASPHYYHRAVDLRSNHLKPEDTLYVVNLINLVYPFNHNNLQTILWHDVGQGWHFHVQVKP